MVGIVVGLAILAIAIGAIWLNSFIHSPAFRDEVEARASQSLGGTVQIETVDFDVLHGIKLRGLVTQLDPSHAGGQGALKASIAQVDCSYSFWDLLSRKLRLTGVVLDQPEITLTKQPTAPMETRTESPAAAGSGGAASSSPASALPFQFVLDRTRVNGGHVTVLDANGGTMVDLKGLNVDADTSGYVDGRDVTATVRVEQVVASGLQVTDFSTPIVYHANYLAAKPFAATAFSGRLAGAYLLDGSGPSVLDLNGNSLSVEQLNAAASPGTRSHLTGSLDFQSKWRGIEAGGLDGEGDAVMTNGKLENVKLLQDMSRLLRINELENPDITKAQTHFVVRDQVVKFIGLQVESPVFKITGDGTVAFSGPLDANLVLALSRDAMSKLPKELAASFVQQPDGTGSIAFHVFGTTSDPQTNLPERLLLQNTKIKNVLDKALNKFFH